MVHLIFVLLVLALAFVLVRVSFSISNSKYFFLKKKLNFVSCNLRGFKAANNVCNLLQIKDSNSWLLYDMIMVTCDY